MATARTASKKGTSSTTTATATPGGPAATPRATPMITSMTPNHLGLKIGVRYADKADMAGFLPIVGWATVGNYLEAGTAALTPVIKGPGNQPMLASAATVKGFVGLFPIESIVGDILAGPNKERPV
jgi:hypothetical protein